MLLLHADMPHSSTISLGVTLAIFPSNFREEIFFQRKLSCVTPLGPTLALFPSNFRVEMFLHATLSSTISLSITLALFPSKFRVVSTSSRFDLLVKSPKNLFYDVIN